MGMIYENGMHFKFIKRKFISRYKANGKHCRHLKASFLLLLMILSLMLTWSWRWFSR